MINKFWIFIGGIVFLIASYKTYITQKIVGKAGFIDLGGYTYIIVLLLFFISIFLFYILIKEKDN